MSEESTASPGGEAGPGGEGRRDRAPLLALLACLAAWAGWFIARTSFVASGRRVFCLFEDAMISMTYARNLVEGHGLNWARTGAPVEGFTHPLWLLLMVPVNALPGLDLRYRSLLVQLLSLAILLVHVVLVRRLVLRHFAAAGTARHWMPAALLTAFYYPLDYWALMGMESGLQALLVTACVLVALDIADRGLDRHLALWLLATAAVLLRLDMILMVAAVQGFVLWRRRPPASWWRGLALFAAANGGWSLFRWWMYGDLLPNTWYLKLYRIPLDVRLMRGAKLLSESWSDHLLLLVVVGAGVGVLARAGGDRRLARRLALPAVLFLLASAYSVYVGGDIADMDVGMRANRFVVFVMPLVFVLFNALVNQASARVAAWGAVRQAPPVPVAPAAPLTLPIPPVPAADIDLAQRYLVTLATVLALLVADGLWLAADNAANWQSLIVANRPYLVKVQEEVYESLRRLEAVLPDRPGTLVATSAAGIPAYFGSYAMVDLFGYNERHIAREPPALPLAASDFMAYMPGHVKWDTAYVLDRYHPAALLHPWGLDNPAPLLRAAGYHLVKDGGFWLRDGAPAAAR